MAINNNPDIREKIKRRKKAREKRGKSTTLEPTTRGAFPRTAERRYERELVRTVNEALSTIKEVLYPQLDGLIREQRATDPRFDSYIEDLAALIGRIKVIFGEKVKPIDIERNAQDMANSVDNINKATFERQFNQVTGVKPFLSEPWLAAELSNSVQQNVTLITTMHTDYFKNVEFEVLNGFQKGLTTREIQKRIIKKTGASKNRARLIARDQISKLNSTLATKRATGAGVKKFRWSTSQDERVRASHQEVNNKIFTYKAGASIDGASNVLPGQPINCRCVAIPIISSITE